MSHRPRDSVHHLYPVSRGDWRHGRNTRVIDKIVHDAWHVVFDDAVPDEVVQQLLNTWFLEDDICIGLTIGRAYKELRRTTRVEPRSPFAPSAFRIIFPNCRPLEIIRVWYELWVPEGCYSEVSFQCPGLTHEIEEYAHDHELIERYLAQQRRAVDEAIRRRAANGSYWSERVSSTTPV